MIFASTTLAARIERAECRMLSDCAAAVARCRENAGVLARPIAGGIATFTGEGSPLNKLAGLGFGGPLELKELEAVEGEFLRRGTALQVEISCLADPSIGALLTRRGYALAGFENILGRRLQAAATPRAGDEREGIEIARIGAADLAAWIDVVVTGFAAPDAQGVPSHETFDRGNLERTIGDMAAAEGFVRYLARRRGEPAGGASLRVCDGVAQLCGAATLPAHRRRGVQGALLAARLADASRAGCDLAVVTTQPGSKSHENVQRLGFDLLYTRAMLVRSA